MKLSIVIPTFNEETTIRELVSTVQNVQYPLDYEIIIVDDASVDRTYEKEILIRIKNIPNNIRLFKNRINKGKGFSIRKGIKRAAGDIIIVQDADNEYDPRDIPKLIQPILENKAHVVYGSRFLATARPKGMALPNWIANKVLTTLTNMLFGLRLTDMETCYKAFRSEIVKCLPLREDRFAFEPEITALLSIQNIPIMELPISYDGRTAKKGKKIKARDFFFAIMALLRCRFTRILYG